MNRNASLARVATFAAWAALVIAALVCTLAVTSVESFRLPQHGLGLLAAADMPGASAWRLAGHWAIGLLALLPSIQTLIDGEREGKRGLRFAGYLWIIAALGYAMQGFWPLDLENLDSPNNQLHAAANSVWWLGATAGAMAWSAARRNVAAAGFAALLLILALLRAFEWLPDGYRALTGWLQLFAWLGTLVQERQRVLE